MLELIATSAVKSQYIRAIKQLRLSSGIKSLPKDRAIKD